MAKPNVPSLVPKNFKPDDFIVKLGLLAEEYIDECMSKTKEVGTGSGKVIEVKERNIPTIDYFLNIWIPLVKKDETISRSTYYVWLHNEESKLKKDTIKKIDNLFKGLAGDIVANEGKGIFYAKNKLGWSDKQEINHGVKDIGELKFSMKRRE